MRVVRDSLIRDFVRHLEGTDRSESTQRNQRKEILASSPGSGKPGQAAGTVLVQGVDQAHSRPAVRMTRPTTTRLTR